MNRLYLYLSLIGLTFTQFPSSGLAANYHERLGTAESVLIAQQPGRFQVRSGAQPPVYQNQMQMQQRQAEQGQQRQAQEMAAQQQRQAQQQQREVQQTQQRQAESQQKEMQQAQQRQAESQQREMQQAQQRQAESQQREMQQAQQRQAESQQRALQSQQKQAEEQQQRALQEQQKNVQRATEPEQLQPLQQRQIQERGMQNPVSENRNQQGQNTLLPGGSHHFGSTPRPTTLPPLGGGAVPLQSVFHQPALLRGATSFDREQASKFNRNLEKHIVALPGSQAPMNWQQTRQAQLQQYFNSYQTRINNQNLLINRENTFLNLVPHSMLPAWYQPVPNWQYCNGFNLANMNVGPNWLSWGWPSWYGPAPTGFNCEQDYVPTPWIYFPALGQWREAGAFGYDPYGPDENYTGPISVEVVEPVEVPGYNPYGGENVQIINEVFMYNAYYFPDAGRWGYMDRHGYFIWLNI